VVDMADHPAVAIEGHLAHAFDGPQLRPRGGLVGERPAQVAGGAVAHRAVDAEARLSEVDEHAVEDADIGVDAAHLAERVAEAHLGGAEPPQLAGAIGAEGSVEGRVFGECVVVAHPSTRLWSRSSRRVSAK